jgi:hypothetical protein
MPETMPAKSQPDHLRGHDLEKTQILPAYPFFIRR